ncbi:MAG: tetratricopeptide repeat protein, partial [Anaerolineales bacterium]|nr:tetratricopeptide repeat protein [Anaerolineales bacterium]
MFSEAVRAFKSGQRRRARDLLTRLLKAEPNNPEFWLWLSAAVETEKEQVFCLQKAIKLDPNSVAARRGLVMLGALKPEEAALPPAPALTALAPAQTAARALRRAGGFLALPRNREIILIALAGTAAVVMVGALLTLIFAPQVFFPPQVVVITSTPTPTVPPSATVPPTLTPTAEPCLAPRDPVAATPLAAYLCLTQTPLPAPVPTSASRAEDYTSLVRAYLAGQSGDAGAWNQVLSRAAVLRRDQVLSKEPTVYFFEAEAYRYTGQPRDAIASYREALALNAGLAPAYLGQALAEIGTNSLTAALKNLDAALAADPAYVAGWLARAEYYEARGDAARALADYEQARAVAPEDPAVLARLGLAYVANQRLEEAGDVAEAALARDPGQALAYLARARAALAQGAAEAADPDLALAAPYVLDPATFRRLYPVAAALKQENAYAARLLTDQALVQVGLAEPAAARRLLDQAITLWPDDLPLAYLARGRLALAAGQAAEAQADFTQAVSQLRRSRPDSPDLAEALTARGQAYLSLTPPNPERARVDFAEALKLTPDSAAATLGLGRAQLGLNQAENAIGTLTLALGLQPAPAEQALV